MNQLEQKFLTAIWSQSTMSSADKLDVAKSFLVGSLSTLTFDLQKDKEEHFDEICQSLAFTIEVIETTVAALHKCSTDHPLRLPTTPVVGLLPTAVKLDNSPYTLDECRCLSAALCYHKREHGSPCLGVGCQGIGWGCGPPVPELCLKCLADSDTCHCSTLNGNQGEATNTDDHSAVQFNWRDPNPISIPAISEWDRLDPSERIYRELNGVGLLGSFGRQLGKLFYAASSKVEKHRLQAQFEEAWQKHHAKNLHWEVPVTESRAARDEQFNVRLQNANAPERLNGNNGAATNSDDVKGGKKGSKMPKQPRLPKGPKQPRGPRAGTVYPSGLPIVDKSSTPKRFEPIRNFRVKIGAITSPQTIKAAGQIFLSLNMDRAMFRNTPLAKKFQLYDKWVHHGSRFEIIPELPTNTGGNAYVVVDPDPADQLVVGSVQDISYFTGHGAREHSIFGGEWGITLPGKKEMLYCDEPFVTGDKSNLTDERLTSAGEIIFACAENFTTTATVVAALYCVFNGDFYYPAATDNDSVIACVKATGLNTGTIMSLGAGVYDMVTMLKRMITGAGSSTTASLYSEYAYQPVFFNGGSASPAQLFQLPLGSYVTKFMWFWTTDPGAITTNLNITNSPVFSWDAQFVTTSQSSAMEWISLPNSPTAFTFSTQLWGLLRVVGPGLNTPNAFLFNPSVQPTNSVSCVGMQIIVQALGNPVTAPYASHYPYGNSGTAIEVSLESAKQEVLKMEVPKPIASARNVDIPDSVFAEFLNWRRSRDDIIHIRQDDDEKNVTPSTADSRAGWQALTNAAAERSGLAVDYTVRYPTGVTAKGASWFPSLGVSMAK